MERTEHNLMECKKKQEATRKRKAPQMVGLEAGNILHLRETAEIRILINWSLYHFRSFMKITSKSFVDGQTGEHTVRKHPDKQLNGEKQMLKVSGFI